MVCERLLRSFIFVSPTCRLCSPAAAPTAARSGGPPRGGSAGWVCGAHAAGRGQGECASATDEPRARAPRMASKSASRRSLLHIARRGVGARAGLGGLVRPGARSDTASATGHSAGRRPSGGSRGSWRWGSPPRADRGPPRCTPGGATRRRLWAYIPRGHGRLHGPRPAAAATRAMAPHPTAPRPTPRHGRPCEQRDRPGRPSLRPGGAHATRAGARTSMYCTHRRKSRFSVSSM